METFILDMESYIFFLMQSKLLTLSVFVLDKPWDFHLAYWFHLFVFQIINTSRIWIHKTVPELSQLLLAKKTPLRSFLLLTHSSWETFLLEAE